MHGKHLKKLPLTLQGTLFVLFLHSLGHIDILVILIESSLGLVNGSGSRAWRNRVDERPNPSKESSRRINVEVFVDLCVVCRVIPLLRIQGPVILRCTLLVQVGVLPPIWNRPLVMVFLLLGSSEHLV